MNASDKIRLLQRLVGRVTLHAHQLDLVIHTAALWDEQGSPGDQGGDDIQNGSTLIEVPVQLRRCGLVMRLIVRQAGQPVSRIDPKLIALIGKAHDWFERLSSGRNDGVMSIAQQDKVSSDHVSKVLNLAFLAPDIVHRIHRGEQPLELNSDRLVRMVPLPQRWDEQRKVLGMSG